MHHKNEPELDQGHNWNFWYIVILIINIGFITLIYQYFSQIS